MKIETPFSNPVEDPSCVSLSVFLENDQCFEAICTSKNEMWLILSISKMVVPNFIPIISGIMSKTSRHFLNILKHNTHCNGISLALQWAESAQH